MVSKAQNPQKLKNKKEKHYNVTNDKITKNHLREMCYLHHINYNSN